MLLNKFIYKREAFDQDCTYLPRRHIDILRGRYLGTDFKIGDGTGNHRRAFGTGPDPKGQAQQSGVGFTGPLPLVAGSSRPAQAA